MVHQAPVVFRYSLLFMLSTENGEELVVTAGNVDVGPVSMISQQRLSIDTDPIQTEWTNRWNKRSRRGRRITPAENGAEATGR